MDGLDYRLISNMSWRCFAPICINCYGDWLRVRISVCLRVLRRQIALADLVIINKVDLIGEEVLNCLKEEVRKINSHSKILLAERCEVDINEILDIRAYSSFSQNELIEKAETEGLGDAHHLDSKVTTVTLDVPISLTRDALKRFLSKLLWEKVTEGESGLKSVVLRLKGGGRVCVKIDTRGGGMRPFSQFQG
ncbi:hypothetical protein RUM44_011342 [Polyplax serrata]|uniref:CobW/HypB/UreG nucleotide-binding domain-containing protein n=1 Tax=Polyplax serrata TaxID=468196 RepID=A0ABR1APR1_POLSC